jgi:hypothetical protein
LKFSNTCLISSVSKWVDLVVGGFDPLIWSPNVSLRVEVKMCHPSIILNNLLNLIIYLDENSFFLKKLNITILISMNKVNLYEAVNVTRKS